MIKIHLSKLLGERKLSRADLVRLTGIRFNTISDMYHEIVVKIDVDYLDKICEALNCSLADLLEYVPNKRRSTGKDLIVEEHGNRKKTVGRK